MVRSINAVTLLTAWDMAIAGPVSHRAVALLSAAWPGRSADEWAHVPLGVRDHALLQLREVLFGTSLESTAKCPSCGERIEARFRTTDIATSYAPETMVEQECGGRRVRFRPPSQADLAAAVATTDPRATVLARCIESDRDLSEDEVAAVIVAMATLDPQADVHIGLTCPSCQRAHDLSFDIAEYVWADVNDWARHLLAEVHGLASAYGWREEDILAMSAFRRRLYMELIAQ